jgi:hypothetical protein
MNDRLTQIKTDGTDVGALHATPLRVFNLCHLKKSVGLPVNSISKRINRIKNKGEQKPFSLREK